MRRFLALLSVGALAAVVIGAAAALTVNGGAIQAGEDDTLTCTNEANVLGWGLETDDGQVEFVRIELDPDTCDGNDMFVNITDGTGGVIAQGSVTLPNLVGAGGHRVTFPAVDAEDIEDIHVFIEGPTGD